MKKVTRFNPQPVRMDQLRDNRKFAEGKRVFVNKKNHRGSESRLQEHCVNWFRLQHSIFARILFSVPNGGFRSQSQGSLMKKEGMMRGVSDLILLTSRRGYGSLCIELKVGKNVLSDDQVSWGVASREFGNLYSVVRDFDSFRNLINWYLK